jgi:hypothetical protein
MGFLRGPAKADGRARQGQAKAQATDNLDGAGSLRAERGPQATKEATTVGVELLIFRTAVGPEAMIERGARDDLAGALGQATRRSKPSGVRRTSWPRMKTMPGEWRLISSSGGGK